MNLRSGFIVLLLTLSLSACSPPRAVVWKAQDNSVIDFKTFEILPVVNGTGNYLKQDILSYWEEQLRKQFKTQNLQLADDLQTENGVLIVKSIILVYENRLNPTRTMSTEQKNGVASCKFRIILIDKSTSKTVATISTFIESGTVISFDQLGISPGLDGGGEKNLEETAATVASEIADLIQPDETSQ